MSLKKQYLKSKPVCKVTFKLSKEEAKSAEKVRLVGDFNEWDLNTPPMKKLKDGSFSSTVALQKDNQYQFRYLLNDKEWQNDWHADAYVPSPVSLDENSVLSV
ncbi:isoamylase early set domain-containing protein [Glaciecola sp. SC05]|uniref:isoamylase early set domain-containing protein n=1 Tax=Glaciecola sp. SC05 TaxID=1987355 RepID=UPI0035289798